MTDRNRQILMAMLSPAHPPAEHDFASIGPADWDGIRKMAQQHRLGPILHHHTRDHGQDWVIPDTLKAEWQQAHRRSTFAALRREACVRRIQALLTTKGYPFALLKGAWLARHAYPSAALRPMRDLDILVHAADALAVYDMLLAGGFVAVSGYPFTPSQALESRKHLPPLMNADTGVRVEIHVRIVDGAKADAYTADVWSRSKDGYLSPTDNLLHLIVHSAYDHRFNNGPAIYDDIAYILYNHSIDWPLFWTIAGDHDWHSGCVLVLHAALRQHGPMPVIWNNAQDDVIDDAAVDAARLLSLQDHDQRDVISVLGKMKARRKMAMGGDARAALSFRSLVDGVWRVFRGTLPGPTRDDAVKYALLSDWMTER